MFNQLDERTLLPGNIESSTADFDLLCPLSDLVTLFHPSLSLSISLYGIFVISRGGPYSLPLFFPPQNIFVFMNYSKCRSMFRPLRYSSLTLSCLSSSLYRLIMLNLLRYSLRNWGKKLKQTFTFRPQAFLFKLNFHLPIMNQQDQFQIILTWSSNIEFLNFKVHWIFKNPSNLKNKKISAENYCFFLPNLICIF